MLRSPIHHCKLPKTSRCNFKGFRNCETMTDEDADDDDDDDDDCCFYIVSDSVVRYEHRKMSDFKEHVRGITGVHSLRIRGLFGGISTLITAACCFPPFHTKASVFTFLFTLFRSRFLVTKGSSSR